MTKVIQLLCNLEIIYLCKMVKYDSFTKGNFEDFKEFIKENCKKAKIIVKNKNYIFGL